MLQPSVTSTPPVDCSRDRGDVLLSVVPGRSWTHCVFGWAVGRRFEPLAEGGRPTSGPFELWQLVHEVAREVPRGRAGVDVVVIADGPVEAERASDLYQALRVHALASGKRLLSVWPDEAVAHRAAQQLEVPMGTTLVLATEAGAQYLCSALCVGANGVERTLSEGLRSPDELVAWLESHQPARGLGKLFERWNWELYRVAPPLDLRLTWDAVVLAERAAWQLGDVRGQP